MEFDELDDDQLDPVLENDYIDLEDENIEDIQEFKKEKIYILDKIDIYTNYVNDQIIKYGDGNNDLKNISTIGTIFDF